MDTFAFALFGLGSFILLAGLVAVLVAAKRAPHGFEDGAGFNFDGQTDATDRAMKPAVVHARFDKRMSA